MNTPLYDFAKEYRSKGISRLHMPGHKGIGIMNSDAGNYSMDITEVEGADSLYHASGIIRESELNATAIFGSGRTYYSAEGSTHCIKSMVALAVRWKQMQTGKTVAGGFKILALRNVHKAFINACALLDVDAVWVYPDKENNSICECKVSNERIERIINETDNLCALYMTSPDYLGNMYDVGEISKICHRHNILLLVDNAHGSYLKFLEKSAHPMDLGADMCSDSAHKTLPVLTGGAYLHISKSIYSDVADSVKDIMSLFGSTSPSYLIMESLDICNKYLANDMRRDLAETIIKVSDLKNHIRECGFKLVGDEPVKVTVHASAGGISGERLADMLRFYSAECEFADRDFVVLMFTAFNTDRDYERLIQAFDYAAGMCGAAKEYNRQRTDNDSTHIPVRKMTVREAVLSLQRRVNVDDAEGRICGMSVVSCPPAIPIIISGELVDEDMVRVLKYNGVEEINVVE